MRRILFCFSALIAGLLSGCLLAGCQPSQTQSEAPMPPYPPLPRATNPVPLGEGLIWGDEDDRKLWDELRAKGDTVKSLRKTTSEVRNGVKSPLQHSVKSGAWASWWSDDEPNFRHYYHRLDSGSSERYLADLTTKTTYRLHTSPSPPWGTLPEASSRTLYPVPPKLTEAKLDGQPAYKAVLVTEPHSRQTWWYDKSTGLPLQTETDMESHLLVTSATYSDVNNVPESEARPPADFKQVEAKRGDPTNPVAVERTLQALGVTK